MRMKAEDEPETCEHAGAHQRPGQMQNQEPQGEDQFREREIIALRTTNRNLRTKLQMAEVNAKNFAGREAIYVRDRVEGATIINQGRTKLGIAEKRVYEMKKEMDDKQMLMSGIMAEKVHAENKTIKFEEELKTLQGKFDNLWDETTRLYDHTSGKAAQESVAKGIQEMATVLEKLKLAVDGIKKDQIEIFKGAIEENEGAMMEGEVEPTPNCTGKKRERSRSAGSIERTPELVIAGGGKTAEPTRWLKLADVRANRV